MAPAPKPAAAAARVQKSDMYLWEGLDKNGKKVKGEMSGVSDNLIKAVLRRQGINPTSVKKKPKPLFGAGKKKITTKDICVFATDGDHDVLRRAPGAVLRDRRTRP